MFFSRSRRASAAGFVVGLIVLLVGVACRPDRPVVPPPVSAAGPTATSVPVADPDSVGIRYVCENRFRIRNRNDSEIALRWVVAGTTDSGTVTLPPRVAGSPYSETFIDVPDSGTVRLFFGGVRIAAAHNGGGSCDVKRLSVRLEPGVIALSEPSDTAYSVDTTVSYSFAPAPGYKNLLVALDDSLVPASGSVVMSRDHFLWAAADVDVELPPVSDPLVIELHGLLAAADPVAAYQQILDDIGALFNALGSDEASRRVKLAGLVAYDPIRDSSALIRVDEALALHEFRLGSSEYDGSGGSGGGVIIADRLPASAVRETAPGGGCVPQRAPEVPGSPEPTRVVFVNGIQTMEFDAAKAAAQIHCALDKSGQTTDSKMETDFFYNRTWSVQRAQDIRGTVWCMLATVRWGAYWSLLSQVVAHAACTGQAVAISVRTNDYVEAVNEYLQVQLNRSSGVEDADSLARYLDRRRRQDGMHVIFVAHSQGNLLVQQALHQLRDQGLVLPRTDSLCVGAVSLAAPTSANWPVDNDLHSGILIPGDVIGALPGVHRFPLVPTPLSDSLAAEVAAMRDQAARTINHQDRRSLYALATEREFLNGFRLHSLGESYLGQQPARDAIVNDVVHIHRQCTIGQLTLDPPTTTLRVQSTIPLALSAVNRNSTDMILNRSVTWNVPSRLSLARNQRRVTAVSPGMGEITARVFDREARMPFEVPMESLTVQASQTLHTSWKFDESNAPPDYPAPDVGAPPEWDGIPGHCTGIKINTAVDSVHRVTYTWAYVAHCWYSASGTVLPPDGIHIARYWWRWFDAADVERISPTNRLTDYKVQDMPADEPLAPFAGWGRLEVWGLNADGVPIAKGTACILNCEGAP